MRLRILPSACSWSWRIRSRDRLYLSPISLSVSSSWSSRPNRHRRIRASIDLRAGRERELLRDVYLSALRYLADLAAEAGQADQAINYLRQAFRKDEASEAACLNLMLALAEAGHRTEALQHYAACEKALIELDLAPSVELRAAQRDLLATRLISLA